MKSSATVAT